MNILAQADAQAWMTSRRYDVIPYRPRIDLEGNPQRGNEGFVEIDAQWHVTSFQLTVQTDGRTQILLADRIARWFDHGAVMLWVTVGTYPDDENRAVFLQDFRRLGVGTDTLYNHYLVFDLANASDSAGLERLLLLMLAFNLEGCVLGENAQSMAWMADEIIKLATSSQEGFDQAQAIVEDLDLTLLQPNFYWWSP